MGDLRSCSPYCRPTFFCRLSLSLSRSPVSYVEAAAVTVVAVVVLEYVLVLPGLGRIRLAEQWAAGHKVDRASALAATYTWARRAVARGWRSTLFGPPCYWSLSARSPERPGRGSSSTGSWAPSSESAVPLIGVHSFVEAALRPVRVAIAGDTGIGDSLPRSRPTFAAWTNLSMIAVAFSFAVAGAMLAAVFDRAREAPCSAS